MLDVIDLNLFFSANVELVLTTMAFSCVFL